MFARIARRYDLANRLLSGGADIRWRRALMRRVAVCNPNDVLDLATGSGDVAFSLSRGLPAAVKIVGMDFCEPMLAQARRKQKTAAPSYANVSFLQGDGMALPLADESFDTVTISFGLRNMADRHRSLCEMRRVLRTSGKLFVLEFSQPDRWFRPLYLFYLRRILPTVAGVVTGDRAAYRYLNETIEEFPNREELANEILAAGFRRVTARGMTFGIVALHEATK